MSKKGRREKLRRNDPCSCGSGRKFKKCHGAAALQPSVMPIDSSLEKKIIQKFEALKKQRQKQQGLGRPIISTTLKENRFVAVGKELLWSEKWKTFHDFLFDYIKSCFGKEWWFGELEKSPEKKHPILIWAEFVYKYSTNNFDSSKKVQSAPTTGAVDAYLGLAYNLYLLAHNIELQKSLVNRLKNKDQFLGAYYETFVSATFIKAGFVVDLEDETDISTSHCEFTATYKETGNKFSVEAWTSPEIADTSKG